VMGGTPYVLEVSSPGVDRPLTAPRHWRRARGRLVRAVLQGGEVATGRVVAADDEQATLEVDGRERRLAYAGVTSARVQVEFGRVDGPDDDGPDDDGADDDGADDDGPDGADPEEVP
jgi:ribosome maturation factor RimP